MIEVKQLTTPDFDKCTPHIQDFIGAFPCDRVPRGLKKDFSMVLNTDNHNKDGQHWVCVHVNSDSWIFYDTFGRSPTDISFPKDFRRVLKRLGKGKRLTYNPNLVQELDSNCCGYYCLYFLDRIALKQPKRAIFNVFGNSLERNDKFVYKYYKKNFD